MRRFSNADLLLALRQRPLTVQIEWAEEQWLANMAQSRPSSYIPPAPLVRVQGLNLDHLADELIAFALGAQQIEADAENAFAAYCRRQGIKLGGQFAGDIEPGHLAGYKAGRAAACK